MVTNLLGLSDRRCSEPLPAPTGNGLTPITTDNGIEWIDLSEGLPGSEQDASEVLIAAIPALPGADNVQEALEALTVRPYRLMVGMGGDTADVVTGNTVTFRAPDAFTLTSVRASVKTASTLNKVDIDVRKNGVSVFSTRVTIDQDEKTSVTASVPAVLPAASIADDDEISVRVMDGGNGAEGAVVTLKGTYS